MRVKTLIAATLVIVTPGITSLPPASGYAQQPASVSGRITLEGKPAAGVMVWLIPKGGDQGILEMQRAMDGVVAGTRTTTDLDGNFRFASVAPGTYEVEPFSPAHLLEGVNSVISVEEGQSLEGIDFKLSRAAVITGRITGPDGKPIVGQTVATVRADDDTRQYGLRSPRRSRSSNKAFTTDDRGIYRVYGIEGGRYIVSVMRAEDLIRVFSGADFVETYYPGVTDQTKATPVTVAAGQEITGIDFRIGQPPLTFSVSGRVIDAETGRPVPNVAVVCGPGDPEGGAPPGVGFGPTTNAAGEFVVQGLVPGSYRAVASFGLLSESEFYSESTLFEIKHENVSGVEIRVGRGGVITGQLVVEGSDDSSVATDLSQLEIMAMSMGDPTRMAFAVSRGKVNPDGSFRVSGLAPGTARLMSGDFFGRTGLATVRMEHNGTEVEEGIEVRAGEVVTGVTVFMARKTGVLRGELRTESGELPKGVKFHVRIQRSQSYDVDMSRSTTADNSGSFSFDNLTPGEYVVMVYEAGQALEHSLGGTETVTVPATGEARVSIVMKSIAQNKNEPQPPEQ